MVLLSGELGQHERNQALQALRDGHAQVCIATDVAARGIDLPSLGLVIHADLPHDVEKLQHRSGRTGRAGLSGIAISFCEFEELPYLKDIEKLIKKSVPRVDGHPYPMVNFESAAKAEPAKPAAKQQAKAAPAKQSAKQPAKGEPTKQAAGGQRGNKPISAPQQQRRR